MVIVVPSSVALTSEEDEPVSPLWQAASRSTALAPAAKTAARLRRVEDLIMSPCWDGRLHRAPMRSGPGLRLDRDMY
jgi:hypothetical protein